MKLQPLKNYRGPGYPTQESLCRETELLRAVPRRWRGKRAVLAALAGALSMMNQSCSHPHFGRTMGKPAPPKSMMPEDEAKAVVQHSNRPKPKTDWAPIPGKVAVPRAVVPEDEANARMMGAPIPPAMNTEEETKQTHNVKTESSTQNSY